PACPCWSTVRPPRARLNWPAGEWRPSCTVRGGLGDRRPRRRCSPLALRPQAPDPHGPPRQPVRGPPRGPGPPRRLFADRLRGLLPRQDGIPAGGGGWRSDLGPGAQVREELEAQLSRFRELLGRDPTHVDGHQHVHVLPGVCRVFAEALQACGVRFTRLPLERGVDGCAWLEAPARAFAGAVEQDARAAIGPFVHHGLRWTDVFVGLSTCGRNMSTHRVLEALTRALEGTPTGQAVSAELMAHPGYPSVPPLGGCGEGPDAFSCSSDRLHELRVLTAPALRAQLARDGVQLCTLEDLDRKRPREEAPSKAARETLLEPSPP
uniref:YdjC chitooligosaccharide deacetylase homolog n=1 Tax=Ovis aries TaxID=9940 RepID=A0AC11EE98_SHEEP